MSVIGRGGFATVYRAHQASFNRNVAIKVLDIDDVSDAAVARFERECRAIGSLSGHPNIVTVFDAGMTDAGRPYIAMEFMDRGSLAARLKREKALTPQETVRIGQEILDAIAAAHEIGIVHRDIKPDNVLISRYGRPQIADFGISSVPGAYETRTGTGAATMGFAAPEVIDGNRAVPGSDLYSVAATLATLLAGRPPFSKVGDDSLVAYINRILREDPPDLTAYGASPELSAVLHRGLAKSAEDRFASAADFREALAAVPEATGAASTARLHTGAAVGSAGAVDLPETRTLLREHLQEKVVAARAAAAPALGDDYALQTIRKDFVPGHEVVDLPSGPDPDEADAAAGGRARRKRLLVWGGAGAAAVVVAALVGAALLSGGDAAEPKAKPTKKPTVAARLAPTVTTTCTGLACELSATHAASEPAAAGATYVWSFGDGTSQAGAATLKHRFPKVGTYAVSVTETLDGEQLASAPVNVGLASFTRKVGLTVDGDGLKVTMDTLAKCKNGVYSLQRDDSGWAEVKQLTPTRSQRVDAEPGTYRILAKPVAAAGGVCAAVTSPEATIAAPVVTHTQSSGGSTYTPPPKKRKSGGGGGGLLQPKWPG